MGPIAPESGRNHVLKWLCVVVFVIVCGRVCDLLWAICVKSWVTHLYLGWRVWDLRRYFEKYIYFSKFYGSNIWNSSCKWPKSGLFIDKYSRFRLNSGNIDSKILFYDITVLKYIFIFLIFKKIIVIYFYF